MFDGGRRVLLGFESVAVYLAETGYQAIPVDEHGNPHPEYPRRPAIIGGGPSPADAIENLMQKNPPLISPPQVIHRLVEEQSDE